jgi:hypothetical protein
METLTKGWEYATSTYTGTGTALDVQPFLDAPIQWAADRIAEALEGADEVGVRETTKNAARMLLRLLSMYPEPQEIVIEASGEIAFEWHKDRNHVAVVTVDGQNVKWAAMLGPEKATSGIRRFDKREMPKEVLAAIDAAV